MIRASAVSPSKHMNSILTHLGFSLGMGLCGMSFGQPQFDLSDTDAETEITSSQSFSRQVFLMGTWLSMELEAKDADVLSEQILATIESVETRLSVWSNDSEVSKCNALKHGSQRKLSPALASDIQRAKWWSDWSSNRFAPLEARSFQKHQSNPLSQTNVSQTNVAQPPDWLLSDGTLQKIHPEARIDTDAFAKGAALEAVRQILPSHAKVALNFGGQVLVHNASWTGAISASTDRHNPELELCLTEGSLSSSGTTQRKNRIRDPKTGTPSPFQGHVAIWAPNAFDADCASTACFLLGPGEAIRRVNATPNLECRFQTIASDGRIETIESSGWKKRFPTFLPDKFSTP